MNKASVVQEFTFDDMAKISRTNMGHAVPIELYRAIRLIGMYQGLPMRGKGTAVMIVRKVGESLPVHSLEELFTMFRVFIFERKAAFLNRD